MSDREPVRGYAAYDVAPPEERQDLDGLAAEMNALEALYRRAVTLRQTLLPHKPANPAVNPGTYAQGIVERQGLLPPLGRLLVLLG